MRYYVFDLQCPRCNKISMITLSKEECNDAQFDPRVNCGDCLMNDIEIVEFKIILCQVVDA